LASALSMITSRFNRWRLVFLIFLVVYAALMLLYLDYAPIRWDETPHLYGGLLLSRGQFDEYLRESAFYPPLLDATTALYFKTIGLSVLSARLVAVTFGLWTKKRFDCSCFVVFDAGLRLFVQNGNDRNHATVLFLNFSASVLLLDTHKKRQDADSNRNNPRLRISCQISGGDRRHNRLGQLTHFWQTASFGQAQQVFDCSIGCRSCCCAMGDHHLSAIRYENVRKMALCGWYGQRGKARI